MPLSATIDFLGKLGIGFPLEHKDYLVGKLEISYVNEMPATDGYFWIKYSG